MSKTSKIVSLAGAAALSAGIGLAAAPQAQAAGSVWDRVAACESGGNWSINTGNGFYGGLQFTSSTWLAYGGGQYASSANQATKAQQIAIAQKVLASQGPGAWPVCSVKAGLTSSNGQATSSTVTSSVTKAVAVKSTTTQSSTTQSSTVKKSSTKGAKYVTVKRGDTLGKIAKRNGTSWKKVWQLNRSHLTNPNMIFVGESIRVA